MSEEILSQDDIDSLFELDGSGEVGGGLDAEALAEMLHVTLKAGIEAVAESGGGEITLGEGSVNQGTPADWLKHASGPPRVVLPFEVSGATDGSLALVLPLTSALTMAGQAVEDESTDWSESHAEAIGQTSEAVAGALGEAISAILSKAVRLQAGPPGPLAEQGLPFSDAEPIWFGTYDVTGAGEDQGQFTLLLPEPVAANIMAKLEEQMGQETAAAAAPAVPAAASGGSAAPVGGRQRAFQPEVGSTAAPAVKTGEGAAPVSPVQFGSLGSPQRAEGGNNIDLILDVPLQVTVELGRAHLQIRQILDLSKGSVIELDKFAGEPVDIYVNGKLIAKGEVVVMDEHFGVKISDIVSKVERVNNLQQ